jgi:hypothetical protein
MREILERKKFQMEEDDKNYFFELKDSPILKVINIFTDQVFA